MNPAMKKVLGVGFDEALAKLKRKIGADFRRYKILGACNPALDRQPSP